MASGVIGGKTVGTTEARLVAASRPINSGFRIKASPDNTAGEVVYVGLSSSVAAGAGYPLGPGEWTDVPKGVVSDLYDVWVEATAADQNVGFIIL